MQRRNFLKLSLLVPFAFGDWPGAIAAVHGGTGAKPNDGHPHRFQLSSREFLLDGKPFQILSGEMHPIRIPRAYWRQRIRMAKAMGLNTIALYVMWNALESEPGRFDLTTGRRDFAEFIRICQQEGLWVYLRPGPYICGEWDFGGLPPYLLRHPHIRVRDKDDPDYMAAVRRYIATLAPVVKPLMVANGGPVLMVQIENEYASFGRDLGYLELLRALWEQHGVDGPFSISDGLKQLQDAGTYVPGTALGLDGDIEFKAAQPIAGEMPVWEGEGYPGWLTHWGDPDFAKGDFAGTMRTLLGEGRSFNLYVVHGGTNFGFGAGANANDDYANFQPVITSYDYGAPIDERGVATPAWYVFRDLITAATKRLPVKMPATPPSTSFPPVTPAPFASVWDNLPAMKRVAKPEANELLFAQDHGLVVYRRRIHAGGELALDGVRDYATVFLDGRYVDYVSRVVNAKLRAGNQISLPAADATGALLEILIDSFGHVNYGHAMIDRKGLVGNVRLDGEVLPDWEAVGLPLDPAWLAALRPLSGKLDRPGLFFKATLHVGEVGDFYVDMREWSKGYLWLNGHLLGRYWHIGPQQRLYCPAPWLREGDNELVIFDLHRTTGAAVTSALTLHGRPGLRDGPG